MNAPNPNDIHRVDELEQLIRLRQEARNLEYKASFKWSDENDRMRIKIAKSCMAMANLRDGGNVVIGVGLAREDGRRQYELQGMTQEEFDSFDQDNVTSFVNSRANPHVELTVGKRELNEGKFVVLQVTEFSEMPIIAKDGRDDLRSGNIYTRSKRQIETRLVQEPEEMREIIDLAVEKQLIKFRRWATLAVYGPSTTTTETTVDERFAQERGEI